MARSRGRVLAAAVAAISAVGWAVAAWSAPIAFATPETAAPETLVVRVPSAVAGGVLPHEFSGYGKNHSPAIAWSGAPAGVKSFALFVEDPDGEDPKPVIHWVAWNIAPSTDQLARSLRNEPELKKPLGMRQGANSHGGVGWTGPHPPVGDPAHHYHVQVFALNRRLGLAGGAGRDAVLRALRGHVIARGETIVLFAEPAPKPLPG